MPSPAERTRLTATTQEAACCIPGPGCARAQRASEPRTARVDCARSGMRGGSGGGVAAAVTERQAGGAPFPEDKFCALVDG